MEKQSSVQLPIRINQKVKEKKRKEKNENRIPMLNEFDHVKSLAFQE